LIVLFRLRKNTRLCRVVKSLSSLSSFGCSWAQFSFDYGSPSRTLGMRKALSPRIRGLKHFFLQTVNKISSHTQRDSGSADPLLGDLESVLIVFCAGRRKVAKPSRPIAIRVAFLVSGATRVQPPYYAVDNIDAVDKLTPRFVTRETLYHAVDAIDTLGN
jgi:hypothetical protein